MARHGWASNRTMAVDTAFHQDTLQTGNNWTTFSATCGEPRNGACCWNHEPRAANALAGSSWSALQQRFDAARKLMKTQPTERNHLRAIFTGHLGEPGTILSHPGTRCPQLRMRFLDLWSSSWVELLYATSHKLLQVPDDGFFKALGWPRPGVAEDEGFAFGSMSSRSSATSTTLSKEW